MSFNYDSRVGIVRKSMKRNPLLQAQQNCEVGRSRRRFFNCDEMTFGKPSDHDETGVAHALNQLCPSEVSFSTPEGAATTTKQRRPCDFLSVNKSAVRYGVATVRQLSRYRALMPMQTERPLAVAATASVAPPCDIVHGVQCRRSPPISKLLTETYRDQWLSEQRSKKMNQKNHHEANKSIGGVRVALSLYADTRGSALRQLYCKTKDKNGGHF